MTFKGTLRQVFISLRPPLLLGFSLGQSCNFAFLNLVRYRVLTLAEYGWSPTGPNTPRPLPATHCLYILYSTSTQRRGEGGG